MKQGRILVVFLLMWLFFGCTKITQNATPTTQQPTTTGPTNNGSSGNSGSGPIVIYYTSTSPCAPSNEKFTFTCSGSGVPSGTVFEWYFGDGNSGAGSPVVNAYTDGGYKTVLVKLKKEGQFIGQQTMSVKTYGQDITPIASFTIQLKAQIGTQITYEFQSNSWLAKGSPEFKWEFGDSTKASGIKVEHTYQQKIIEQKVNVKLTVKSDAGCSDSKTIQLTIPPAFNISGGFTITSTSPCLPSREVFTFTAPKTNVPSGAIYAWDFADGSGIAYGNPITKAYVNNNSYNVILTIYYQGKEIYKTGQPVRTYGLDATPLASFYKQFIGSSNTTYIYNLNNTSQVNGGFSNTRWDWDFGDGTNASGVIPNYDKTYNRLTVDMNYTVTMTVYANSGCSATSTVSLFVPKQ